MCHITWLMSVPTLVLSASRASCSGTGLSVVKKPTALAPKVEYCDELIESRRTMTLLKEMYQRTQRRQSLGRDSPRCGRQGREVQVGIGGIYHDDIAGV